MVLLRRGRRLDFRLLSISGHVGRGLESRSLTPVTYGDGPAPRGLCAPPSRRLYTPKVHRKEHAAWCSSACTLGSLEPTLSRTRLRMWLLSTSRAELKWFISPEYVQEGYAILSHVWDSRETSFQEMEMLRIECAGDGRIPRDHAPAKVRDSCLLAERHGYRWLWNDTCCINKESSAELGEAINSMFQYYCLAEVCYAYLHDVSRGCVLEAEDSEFRRSRWYTRGWTLQELIAPHFLVFVAQDWSMLGDKASLAGLIEEITRIPVPVLRGEVTPLDSSVSIAQRMSWAAERETSRVEDRAYSLMGLFDVNMPTIYGEGTRAFRRLQEEIMKDSGDTSLFVWGDQADDTLNIDRLSSLDPTYERKLDSQNLLAPSPSSFSDAGSIHFRPSSVVAVSDSAFWCSHR